MFWNSHFTSILIWVSFAIIAFVSCNSTTEQIIEKGDSVTLNFDSSEKINYKIEEAGFDTSQTARVITPGTYHSDEVWVNADKEEWFGIFKNNNDYCISKTRIKTIRVNDPVLDDSSQKTGWEVSVSGKNFPVLLVSGLDYLIERNIEETVIPPKTIIPGEKYKFSYHGIEYTLYATGYSTATAHKDSYNYEAMNYKLILKANKNNKVITDEIFALPVFTSGMIQIDFAGDIDGDGMLDLILNIATDNNVWSKALFLSKPASSNKLIKKVGEHTSMGC